MVFFFVFFKMFFVVRILCYLFKRCAYLLCVDFEDIKGKISWDTLHTMVEAKCALKWLMEQAVCAKTDLTQTQGKLKDTEYNDHDSKEEIEKLEKELSYQSRKHEKKITALQKQHEEKVHVHVYLGSLSPRGLESLRWFSTWKR